MKTRESLNNETNKKIRSKIRALSIILIIFICFSIFAFIILFSFIFRKNLDIMVSDDISGLSIYDNQNRAKKISDFKENNCYIAYMSPSCTACIDELPSIENIMKSLPDNNGYAIILLWDKDIPEKRLSPDLLANSYYIKRERIHLSTPYYYIAENNKIVFETGRIDKFILRLKDNLTV